MQLHETGCHHPRIAGPRVLTLLKAFLLCTVIAIHTFVVPAVPVNGVNMADGLEATRRIMEKVCHVLPNWLMQTCSGYNPAAGYVHRSLPELSTNLPACVVCKCPAHPRHLIAPRPLCIKWGILSRKKHRRRYSSAPGISFAELTPSACQVS